MNVLASALFWIGGIMIGFAWGSSTITNENNELIAACEQNLSRSQHCELTAVPVLEQKK
jgi:hypothetical protein